MAVSGKTPRPEETRPRGIHPALDPTEITPLPISISWEMIEVVPVVTTQEAMKALMSQK